MSPWPSANWPRCTATRAPLAPDPRWSGVMSTSGAVLSKSPRPKSGLTKVKRLQPATTVHNNTSTMPCLDRARMRATSRSGITCSRCLEGLAELGLSPGTIHHLTLELPAGGINVVAPGAPHRSEHTSFLQQLLERADVLLCRTLEAGAGERIERNQVDLRRILHLGGVVELPHQPRQLAGVHRLVVDALHEGVFEGDGRARLAGDVALAGGHQFF